MIEEMRARFDLAGKKAIVTGVGAMEGIGRYLAEGLCEAGAEVVLINRSERMFTVRDYLREKGYAVHGVIADLGEREQLRRAFAESMELLGSHLDILVNCAGIQRRMPSVDFEEQAWDDVVNINLNAVFFLSQLAAREMIPQHKGKIINVASMLSYFGGCRVPAYTAAKTAVMGLTRALTNEWAAEGINVNAIAPGYIATDMGKPLMEDPVRNKEIIDRIPSKAWGDPKVFKDVVVFLASEASNYICGATIPVDGGFLCR